MQELDHRKERGSLRADGSGPLPQFTYDAAASELDVVSDSAPTLESVPLVTAARAARVLAGHASRRGDDFVGAARAAAEPDMAVTIELLPEVSGDDILEAEAARPPLVLPPRDSSPLDLEGLLAYSRAETRRSGEYFQPSSRVAPASAPYAFVTERTAPTVVSRIVPRPPVPAPRALDDADHDPFALAFAPRPAKTALLTPAAFATPAISFVQPTPATSPWSRRAAWILGTVLAATMATVGVAALQSRISSARSPASISVLKAEALNPAVTPALAPTSGPASTDHGVPNMAVQSLPQVESGTISIAAVAATHRLFVDGRLAPDGSAVVRCGAHTVQVGSRGTPKVVNVPCGQEIVLAN